MSHIRLDPDLSEKLARQAQAQGRSLANLANLLLRLNLGMKATPSATSGKATLKSIRK